MRKRLTRSDSLRAWSSKDIAEVAGIVLAQIPVGRFCEPEEFAHVVRFLVAPLSGFITGEIVDLNGGVIMD